MEHVQERRMIEYVWDGAALTPAESDHLSLCAGCRQQLAMLRLMRDELEVAHLSEMSPEQEGRLIAMLAQTQQDAPEEKPFRNRLTSLTEWARALLLWDSRQQGGVVGVRNLTMNSYRLLFGANETEVELMVEAQDGLRRVIGEVIMAEGQNGLALIELMTSADAKKALETESDENGRFALEQVPPGTYVMTITPRYSSMVIIEPLELT